MEKNLKKIFIVCCIIVLILPIIFFDFREKKSTAENRSLSNFPLLFEDNKFNIKFVEHFQNWMNDCIGFREILVHNYSKLMYYFFDTTSNSKVLKGKNGWLFYDCGIDEEGVKDYKGYNLYDKNTLEKLKNNLIETSEYLKNELGAEFILFIAPNKNRVYAENLPNYMADAAYFYRTVQLCNYLKENSNIKVVYPYDEMIRFKTFLNNNIYYKTDTHWNHVGGYIGAKELLSAINIKLPDIDGNIVKVVKKNKFSGDLSGMIGMKEDLIDIDSNYHIEGYDDNDVNNIKNNEMEMVEYESKAENDVNMYIIGDSFAINMNKYIGASVHHLWSKYAKFYDKEEMLKLQPNVVVKEIVERELENLNSFKITANIE